MSNRIQKSAILKEDDDGEKSATKPVLSGTLGGSADSLTHAETHLLQSFTDQLPSVNEHRRRSSMTEFFKTLFKPEFERKLSRLAEEGSSLAEQEEEELPPVEPVPIQQPIQHQPSAFHKHRNSAAKRAEWDRKRSSTTSQCTYSTSASDQPYPQPTHRASSAMSCYYPPPPTIDRKRSSTTIGNHNMGLQQEVLRNMSIFKPVPLGSSAGPVIVTQQETSMENVLPNNASILPLTGEPSLDETSPQCMKRGSVGHLKSQTVHAMQHHKSRVVLVEPRLSQDHLRSKSASPFKRNTFPQLDVETASKNHARQISIATFLTSAYRNEIYKDNQQRYFRPRLSLDSLRVPRRWLSLRNVISFFNVLILFIAIFVVALVSYQAGIESTREAISAMSNVTVSNVMSNLNGLFEGAERVNLFTQAIYSQANYPIRWSQTCARPLYFFFTTDQGGFDQMYAVTPESWFVGIAADRDPVTGQLDPENLLVKYLNFTTRPFRWTKFVSSRCTQNDTSCVDAAFDDGTPIYERSRYVAASRPFFQHASSTGRPGWSDIYLYSDNKTLGITAVRPVYYLDKLQFVSAVDLTLGLLSGSLETTSKSITGDTGISPLFFLIETNTGYLVASSMPSLISLLDDSGQRIFANDSDSDPIRECHAYLTQSFGSLTAIKWSNNGEPIIFQTEKAHVVVGRYQRAQGDIDWIITSYIPFETYNGRLNAAHYFQVPFVGLLVFFVSILVSVVVTRAIGRPLKRIARQMLSVADLNFEESEAVEHEDDEHDNVLETQQQLSLWKRFRRWESRMFSRMEIPLKEVLYLKSAMSAMITGLKSFSKYVPLDVVTLLVKMKREAVLGVDEMDITVLFSDIVNFTSVAESVEPAILVQLMNEYLSEMSEIVLQYQGIVDKYIGDAIMAFWNAPISVQDHATIACTVALKCQMRLAELRESWRQRGLPELRMRIGLNTGKALVGNFGSSTRFNYTALGDNVNLASRLESLNKRYETGVIISQMTVDELNMEYFVVRPLDLVTVKGKSHHVKVYELVGFRKLMPQTQVDACDIYAQGFDHWVEGKFDRAAEYFRQYLHMSDRPDKAAMDKMIECFKRSTLSSVQWSPIVVLDEK